MLQAGTVLGNYKILSKLGEGGMADVYEAEDIKLGRRVALKVLPPEFGRKQDLVMRFEKEVRAAAQLDHPGIVKVFDVGQDAGVHYFSMQILRGGDLRQRIQQGMGEEEALFILRQLADAFGHAHGRGFVHRDVKPENIMFAEQGYPVLTDFGIAKAMDSGTRMTATGVSIGTPRYISPEQARGKQVDARADLYSLGVILYEMLTGKPPYDGEESLAVIFKHVTEPIPRLPEGAQRLQPLIDSLMAKDPAQRPGSARALIDEIDKFMPQEHPHSSTVSFMATQQNPIVRMRTPSPSEQLRTNEREHAQALVDEHQRQERALEKRLEREPPPPPKPAAPSRTASPPPAVAPAPPPPSRKDKPPVDDGGARARAVEARQAEARDAEGRAADARAQEARAAESESRRKAEQVRRQREAEMLRSRREAAGQAAEPPGDAEAPLAYTGEPARSPWKLWAAAAALVLVMGLGWALRNSFDGQPTEAPIPVDQPHAGPQPTTPIVEAPAPPGVAELAEQRAQAQKAAEAAAIAENEKRAREAATEQARLQRQEEDERKSRLADEETRKQLAAEQAARKKAELEKQQKADAERQRAAEASRAKLAAEQARKAQAEEARRKAEADKLAADKLATEKAAADKAAADKAAADAKRRADDEETRRIIEEEVVRLRRQEEEARNRANAEAVARQKAQEEAARKKAEDEAARKKAAEAAAKEEPPPVRLGEDAEERLRRKKAEERKKDPVPTGF
ncbi:MAG TPA: protein kinase [Solimonas sp.]|nr:protein kinase [Solimonas sp.]